MVVRMGLAEPEVTTLERHEVSGLPLLVTGG